MEAEIKEDQTLEGMQAEADAHSEIWDYNNQKFEEAHEDADQHKRRANKEDSEKYNNEKF